MTAGRLKRSLAASVLVLPALACIQHPTEVPDLRRAEKRLGTDGRLNWSFHRIVEDAEGIGLSFPGFVIGIEKTDRELLEVPRIDRLHLAPLGRSELAGRKLDRYLKDGKRTFISHLVESRFEPAGAGPGLPRRINTFLYNAYEPPCGDPAPRSPESRTAHGPGLYGASWQALDDLEARLRELFEAPEGERPTHLMLYSMGWNTPQEEAIRNYSSLYGHLATAAAAAGDGAAAGGFRPVFIGLSWPSTWVLPGVSYFNKARDADEIGLVWANYLVNHVLRGIKADTGVPVVLVGHSFGSRLLSRALFSDGVLLASVPDVEVDLFVSLQGAFSMNRFLPERSQGREGAPYGDHGRRRTVVALTWSAHDSANPVANWVTSANNVGGRPGYDRASDCRYRDHFQFAKWSADGLLDAPAERDGRIVMIDASSVIRFGTYDQGGRAHSNIFTAQTGAGVWQLIELFASPPR